MLRAALPLCLPASERRRRALVCPSSLVPPPPQRLRGVPLCAKQLRATRRRRAACVCAAAAAGEGELSGKSALARSRDVKKLVRAATLALLFSLWYAGNVVFNLENKRLLRLFAHPVAVSTLYMFVGGVLGWLSWRLGVVRQPAFSRVQVIACLPLALCHAGTNTLMLTSLNAVAVSLSHTIRATEPLFVTAAASLVLGTRPSALLVWSLVPIVVGVSVASATDVSFSWLGFTAALGSNLASTARNVYSKQVMSGMRGDIDSVSLLTLVNALAFLMLLPVLFVLEGPALALEGWGAVQAVAPLALFSAVLLQLYQQTSYNILSRVSAVTHSVANVVKRVVVIVAAVIFFRHPVSLLNAVGTAMALGGVFLYSQVKLAEKQVAQKKKMEAKAAREALAAAEAGQVEAKAAREALDAAEAAVSAAASLDAPAPHSPHLSHSPHAPFASAKPGDAPPGLPSGTVRGTGVHV